MTKTPDFTRAEIEAIGRLAPPGFCQFLAETGLIPAEGQKGANRNVQQQRDNVARS